MGQRIEIKGLYEEIDISEMIEFTKKSKFLKLNGEMTFEGEKNDKPITSLKDACSNKLKLEHNLKDCFKIGKFYCKTYLASWNTDKKRGELDYNEVDIRDEYRDEYVGGCSLTFENFNGAYRLSLTLYENNFEKNDWTAFFKDDVAKKLTDYAEKNSERLVQFVIDLIKETNPLKLIIDYEGEGICYEGKGDRVDKDEQLQSWFSYSRKLDDFTTIAKACQSIKKSNEKSEGSLIKIIKNCAYKTFELDDGFAVQLSPVIDMHNDPKYIDFYNKIRE